LGCLSFFSLWPLMTSLSFVHWVVYPSLRQPNGEKREESSKVIKRRRTDNTMDKRERGHQRS
jgi:hypothetical protein